MKLAVIGTGHVGLVTSVALATLGHEVAATDLDGDKIDSLERGVAPFFEPGLEPAVLRQVAAARLRFTHHAGSAIPGAEAIFICVGTPPAADGELDCLAVEAASMELARWAAPGAVVVEKATVPAGTADRIGTLIEQQGGLKLEVVSNPEFMREGTALADALAPDRILVGSDSQRGFEVMRRIYAPLMERGVPIIETNVRTAELAKHACNGFLALKISYANALARICERAGADVVTVADVMGADPRIGRDFLDAGMGYGGYCLPKDVAGFIRFVEGLGYSFPLLAEAARINEEAIEAAVEKISMAIGDPEGKVVALLGLSYKPGTDDVRLSPALALARRLMELEAAVRGYDPRAGEAVAAELPDLQVALDPYSAAADADCVVVCTAWEEFRELDLAKLKEVVANPVIVDGRNLLDPRAIREAGFAYHCMGRPGLSAAGKPTAGAKEERP